MQKKLKELEMALDELQSDLDKVTTSWEAEKLEKIYAKMWREYNMILKQIEL